MDEQLQIRLAALEATLNVAQAEIARLQGELVQRDNEIRQLRQKLEEADRAAARQAAPFRRKERNKVPEKDRKKPGRKPGHPGVNRQVPLHIDQEVEVPLEACPCCGGAVGGLHKHQQIIEEIPPIKPVVTKLTTYSGKCGKCGDVRSTHALQTSTAGGAARVQLGPQVLAWATELNKRMGLTMRKVCSIFKNLLGLRLTPGGLSQALDRVARRCQGAYDQIGQNIRERAAVFIDETSWYVGESGWWLWVFTTPHETFYRVEQSRGKAIVKKTLGPDFHGCVISDCATMYDEIQCSKQKCIAHHLQAVEKARHLQNACHHHYLDEWQACLVGITRLYHERPAIPSEEFSFRRGELEKQADELLVREPKWPGDKKVRNRLVKARPHLFTCLVNPDVEPTNNRAERALRPAVIARKVSCGNKTPHGKSTWEILTSFAATCHQQGRSLIHSLLPHLQLAAA